MKTIISCVLLVLATGSPLWAQQTDEARKAGNAESKELLKGLAQDGRTYLDLHVTVLRLVNQHTLDIGFGTRVGHDLNKNLAVEGEVNFFPDSDSLEGQGGRKLQGLLQVKVGKRFERVGLFAKRDPV